MGKKGGYGDRCFGSKIDTFRWHIGCGKHYVLIPKAQHLLIAKFPLRVECLQPCEL